MRVARTHQAQLGIAIPPILRRDYLARLHYLSEDVASFAFAEGRADQMEFGLKPDARTSPENIAARMAALAQTMCASFEGFVPKVLVRRALSSHRAVGDPHPELERRGEIRKLGQGRYGLGPLLTRLVGGFDDAFVKLSRAFQAPEHQFPALIGAEALERCRYLQSFPQSLSVVSHLREDQSLIERFAAEARWNAPVLEVPEGLLAAPKCLLSPSVCLHWYAWSQDSVVTSPRAVTAIGKCFRYESGNFSGLERLWDFTMREMVFMGERDYVLSQRKRAMEETVELLDAWELGYQIEAATDAFFGPGLATQSTFQLAFDLKFEVTAELPYKGSSIAVGSFNHHQDFFGRSFAIRDGQEKPIETSCVGFGLERLAFAFLAQHGLEQEHWPKAVRSFFGA